MATFLLVDDDQSVLSLMKRMLKLEFKDSQIYTTDSGTSGLHAARQHSPDVIMLDITLPDMNGLEVCEKLKTDPQTARTPVIMVTGDRMGSTNRALGLETGADGYLYKPFVPEEFIAVVKVMLRIKRADDLLRSQKEALETAFQEQTVELQRNKEALQIKVNELESILEKQTQELIRADRLASVGILAAGIAHEVNNPNTFITSNLQTFKMFWPKLLQALDQAGSLTPEQTRQIQFIREEMPPLIKGLEEGALRIAAIVSNIKSYATGSQEKNRLVDMQEIVKSSLDLVWNQLKHDIEVETEFARPIPKVIGSEQSLCQVFVNLFLNAAHAMKDYRGEGRLTIQGFVDQAGYVVVAVKDNGPGISPENMKHLFDPFFTTRREKGGTGLGLFVSHGIIKGHNGGIEVETALGKGTTFTVRIPAIDENQSLAVDLEPELTEPAAI